MDMLYFMLRMSLQLSGEGEHAGSNYRPMQHIQGVKEIGATEFSSGTGKTSLKRGVGVYRNLLDRKMGGKARGHFGQGK